MVMKAVLKTDGEDRFIFELSRGHQTGTSKIPSSDRPRFDEDTHAPEPADDRRTNLPPRHDARMSSPNFMPTKATRGQVQDHHVTAREAAETALDVPGHARRSQRFEVHTYV
jgi:hypothetical protein